MLRLTSIADPSIDSHVAEAVAAHCLTMLDDAPATDAAELARRLLGTSEVAGENIAWVSLIARAAVQVCAS